MVLENGHVGVKRSEPGFRSFYFERHLKDTIPRQPGKKHRQRMEKGTHVYLTAAVEKSTELLLKECLKEQKEGDHIVRDQHVEEALSKPPFINVRGFERAACIGGLASSAAVRDLEARKNIIQAGLDPGKLLHKRRLNKYKKQKEKEEEEEEDDAVASSDSESESDDEEQKKKKKKKKSSSSSSEKKKKSSESTKSKKKKSEKKGGVGKKKK